MLRSPGSIYDLGHSRSPPSSPRASFTHTRGALIGDLTHPIAANSGSAGGNSANRVARQAGPSAHRRRGFRSSRRGGRTRFRRPGTRTSAGDHRGIAMRAPVVARLQRAVDRAEIAAAIVRAGRDPRARAVNRLHQQRTQVAAPALTTGSRARANLPMLVPYPRWGSSRQRSATTCGRCLYRQRFHSSSNSGRDTA